MSIRRLTRRLAALGGITLLVAACSTAGTVSDTADGSGGEIQATNWVLRSYDVAGKRDEALAQYKEVLARPNIYDAHDEAKRGLRQAYKAETFKPDAEQQ